MATSTLATANLLRKTIQAGSGFGGNQNLRKPGIQTQFTQQQLDEYIKCFNDPIYFAKTYMKIVNVDRGLIPFDMYDFQEEFINVLWKNRHVVGRMSRQIGKSTCVVAYFLWLILFHEQQTLGILANKAELAQELLSKIRLAYEHLPMWLQQGVVSWNKRSIEIENGSRIIAAATTSSAIRGYAFNAILLDEFAFVPKNIADDFFTSVYPTISSGKTTKLFIISTPLGLNHYYHHWKNAKEGKSGFALFEAFWHQVPGRDEKWKVEEIRKTSELQFSQEHDCDFLGSSHTLISAKKLKEMVWHKPKASVDGLDIYEDPVIPVGKIPGRVYAICVDVSRGLGLDHSAFSVIDVTEIPYKQVAKFRKNDLSPMIYPTIIYNTAVLYNNAYVLVEISDIGQQVADILHYELEYDNLVKVQMKGKQGQQVTAGHVKRIQMGVKTSVATKRIGCANLKTLIEGDKLLVHDEETIEEFATFTSQNETYKADEGYFDDLVMSLVLFGWFISQRHFKDALTRDIRSVLQHEHLNIVEEDVIPWGAVDDGIHNTDEEESIRLDTEDWISDRKKAYPLDGGWEAWDPADRQWNN